MSHSDCDSIANWTEVIFFRIELDYDIMTDSTIYLLFDSLIVGAIMKKMVMSVVISPINPRNLVTIFTSVICMKFASELYHKHFHFLAKRKKNKRENISQL